MTDLQTAYRKTYNHEGQRGTGLVRKKAGENWLTSAAEAERVFSTLRHD
jgi:hypothetical protein